MIQVSLSLSDSAGALLDERVHEGGCAVSPFLSGFVESAFAEEGAFEVTPEVAAVLEEGERSGYVPYSFDEIMAEAKRQVQVG